MSLDLHQIGRTRQVLFYCIPYYHYTFHKTGGWGQRSQLTTGDDRRRDRHSKSTCISCDKPLWPLYIPFDRLPYSAISTGREGPASGRSSIAVMHKDAQPIMIVAAAKT